MESKDELRDRAHFWTTIDRILLICALLGAAFSAGYNYRGLDAMSKELKALQETTALGFSDVKLNYARQDVLTESERRLDEQLTQIRVQLDRIENKRP